MKIGIIGTGAFSIAIANTLAQNKENQIILWSENENLVLDYQKTNKLEAIFKGKVFPKNIKLTHAYEDIIKDSDLLLFMTSIPYLESVCNDIKETINKKIPICIGTKGIYGEKPMLVHQIVKRILKNPIGVLGGPTFANDVLNLEPIAFNVATKSNIVKKAMDKAFRLENVKVVFTKDLNSVALLSSLKNVYAIGCGILKGLGYKGSTHAYYLTYVYKELENILYQFNVSSNEILNHLAGFGDLVATCYSSESRNHTFGVLIGEKKKDTDIENYKKNNTIEGMVTLEYALKLFKRKHIKAPIFMEIYHIVYEHEDAKALIDRIKKMN